MPVVISLDRSSRQSINKDTALNDTLDGLNRYIQSIPSKNQEENWQRPYLAHNA